MSRSVKKTPVYPEAVSGHTNKTDAKHQCNKAIRSVSVIVVESIEYTDEGDAYNCYEDFSPINRTSYKKVHHRTKFPRRIYDGNLDIENAVRLKKRREFDELRTLLHLIVK